ncbi:hypothetical protein [Mesobacillus subterraneus]|nr:hypothetical protein [Mesobacillus subterraneus]
MEYFERVKEIQQLQWQLLMDYWYLHTGLLFAGLVFVVFWVLRRGN